MRITIDASNLQEGGGIVHLKNLLQISDPRIHGFNKIIVYGGRKPLEQLSKKDWLDLREIKNLDRSIPDRLMWQKNFLNKNVKQENSLLFIPGGLFLENNVKFVAMFQNMQIFETLEKNREGLSKQWLRLHFLKIAQNQTFRNSAGLICLSHYALNHLQLFYQKLLNHKEVRIIPHGITKVKKNKKKYRFNERIKLLYVSTVKQYKHQWHLIDAVALLKQQGFPLELHLIGSGDGPAIKRMNETDKVKYIICSNSIPQTENMQLCPKLKVFSISELLSNVTLRLIDGKSISNLFK